MGYVTKYKLLESQRNFLREKRQIKHISAENLSVKIGKSKAWAGQIERGKLFSIKENDLVTILSILYDVSIEVIKYNGILTDFLRCNFSKLNEINEIDCKENEIELLLKKIEELKKENKVKLFEACARLHRFEDDMSEIGFDMYGTDFSTGKGKLFDVCEDIIIEEFVLDRSSKDIDLLTNRMIYTFTNTFCLCEDAYDRIREIVEVEILSK